MRPEFVNVARQGNGTDAPGGENTLSGTVDSLLFNGARSRVLVRGPVGELIEADVTVTGGESDLRAGDAVSLRWSSAQSICFAA